MKILCITRNKPKLNCHELWKRDLCNLSDVYFLGKGYPECNSLNKVIKELKIECLLICGLPTSDYLYRDFSKLDVFKVNILFDYHILEDGSTYKEYDNFLERNNFDLLFAHNNLVLDRLKDKYNVRMTKLSVPPFLYGIQFRDVDVMSSGSTNVRFYKGRKELNRFLKNIKQIHILTKIMKYEDYLRYLEKSKLFVNKGNSFITDCVSLKYLECMVSGTLLITTRPANLDEYGFVDGKHLIIYNDFDDLEEKIFYYLENEYEREQIVKNSMIYVWNNFTNDIVIKKMLRDINECKGN